MQLWDIAGQDRFQKLTRVYFKNAVGVILVCDVSRERTVEAIKGWKSEIDAWVENTTTITSTTISSSNNSNTNHYNPSANNIFNNNTNNFNNNCNNNINTNNISTTNSSNNILPIVLFANKSDLLLSIDDAFIAGAAVEKVSFLQ